MDKIFVTCPKCGHREPDFDGLELLHCPACGYCAHPNSTIENGQEICGFCGRELRQVKLNDHLTKTIEMDGRRVLSVKNPWAYLIDLFKNPRKAIMSA